MVNKRIGRMAGMDGHLDKVDKHDFIPGHHLHKPYGMSDGEWEKFLEEEAMEPEHRGSLGHRFRKTVY